MNHRLSLASAIVSFSVACGSGPTTPIAAPVSASSAAGAASAVGASVPPPASLPHHTAAEIDPALATAQAPDVFAARFSTSKGEFVIEVHRAWTPHGADRFYNLVKLGFFDDTRFFRVIDGFMVQFGISGDPAVSERWREASIQDDPVVESNLRGFVTFAKTGEPNSRTTQIFIVYDNHPRLDQSGFAPFGKIIKGMDVVDALYKGYGEGAPSGKGPSQDLIQHEGNAYLDKNFPKLDKVFVAQIVGQ